MNDRAWKNEALHLRFDKKAKPKQISTRVNIPGSTFHTLFDRFPYNLPRTLRKFWSTDV